MSIGSRFNWLRAKGRGGLDVALCKQCNGRGSFYFGDSNTPRCPLCAGTGESPVTESAGGDVPSPRGTSSKSREGEFFLGLIGLVCLFGAFLAFQYSSDVVLSYFELVYVRDNNFADALTYAATTLTVTGIVSRYWGPVPALSIGVIPVIPVFHACFAGDLGGFPQVVDIEAGSAMVLFSSCSALFVIFGAAMIGHNIAKRKLDLAGVRSLARLNGGPLVMGTLVVLALAAFAVVQVAWRGFVEANAY